MSAKFCLYLPDGAAAADAAGVEGETAADAVGADAEADVTPACRTRQTSTMSLGFRPMLECLTAACKALSLANAKGKGTNGSVIRSLDD